jgi:hypothetical protein
MCVGFLNKVNTVYLLFFDQRSNTIKGKTIKQTETPNK